MGFNSGFNGLRKEQKQKPLPSQCFYKEKKRKEKKRKEKY